MRVQLATLSFIGFVVVLCGTLIACTARFRPTVLLSNAELQKQVAQIDQWESTVLSGRRPLVSQVQQAKNPHSQASVVPMVQAWEDTALSGRRHSQAQSSLTTSPANQVASPVALVRNSAMPASPSRGVLTATKAIASTTKPTVASATAASHTSLISSASNPLPLASSKEQKVHQRMSVQHHPSIQNQPRQPKPVQQRQAIADSPAVPHPQRVHIITPGSSAIQQHPADSTLSAAVTLPPKANVVISRRDKELQAKAAKEEKEASSLVKYANIVAQKIVKEQALDEMKKWLAARQKHSALKTPMTSLHIKGENSDSDLLKGELAKLRQTVSSIESRVGGVKSGQDELQQLKREVNIVEQVGERLRDQAASAKHAAQAAPASIHVAKAPTPPQSDADRIRAEFKDWHKKQVQQYANQEHLFSANEFCNSRQYAAHPTIGELIQLFGAQWRKMAVTNPEVASLAAVAPCLAALGATSPHLATASQYKGEWQQGPLKGKEDAVRKCAKGDNKACVEISRDPAALRELKKLIPPQLRK